MGKGRRLKVLGGGKKGAPSRGNKTAAAKQDSGAPAGTAAATPGPSNSSAQNAAAIEDAKKTIIQREAAKGNFLPKLWEKIVAILKVLGQFFFKRDYPIAHYVALILVIIFLIYGFSFLVVRSRKRKDKKKKKSFWERIFGYRFSNAFQQISGVKPVTEPRPTTVGRCDNVEFVEKRVGNGGVCVTDKLPKPLEWIIDPGKIPELNELPQSIINKISKDGQRFKVTIPWEAKGLVYMPSCSNAMFADGTPAYLLEDGNGICRKYELDKIINTSKWRYNKDYTTKYEGLGKFITDDSSSTVQSEKESGYANKVSAGEVCSIDAAKELGIFDKTNFYKVDYDTLRSYNQKFDKGFTITHRLCSENTVKDEASVLCPLLTNADGVNIGVGFTAKPGNKCVTAECPKGFTEDKKDPMNCIKPTKEKVVQIRSRNDEQYDDWYTIPNYHLGNKFGSSNNVHYAHCPSGSMPYYNSDPVDDSQAEENSMDQLGLCVDKDLFMGGKYAGTADYCPVSLIKRVGSTRNELMEDYMELSGRGDVPDSVKQKINKLVEGIKSDDFTNLGLLSEEMELACNKLQQPDKDGNYPRLKAAYAICEQLAKNEPGFEAKFAGEPESLIKLRKDAAKYSCQQLFGVPLDKRGDPNARNANADKIGEATLNFPDVEQIQFEQYIQEYDNEVREKEKPLPVISAEEEKQTFIDMFKSKTWAAAIWISIIILIGYAIYYYRDDIGNFINCNILNNLIWFINLFKTVTISPRECLSAEEMQKRKTSKIQTKIEAEKAKQEEAAIGKKEGPEAAADKQAEEKPVAKPEEKTPAAAQPEPPEQKKGGALQ